MISRHAVAVTSLLSVSLIWQAAVPGIAQTTMLMGKVKKERTTQALVYQEPRMAPVTYVVTPPRSEVRTVYVRDNRTYFQRHPKVKSAVVGGSVGAAAGAATGLITGRGVLRGAAYGTGAGVGVGLIRSSHTMRRHPIVRSVATGTVAGLGLGLAGSRSFRTAAKVSGVGAAAGLGWGVLRHLD